mgnify:CR=1 FL=1
MDIIYWYQIVGAVIAGNVLTIMLVFCMWSADKAAKKGLEYSDLSWTALACGIIPLLVVLGAIYYATV